MNINKCATELINDTPHFQLARQETSKQQAKAEEKEDEGRQEKDKGRRQTEKRQLSEDSVQDNLHGRSRSCAPQQGAVGCGRGQGVMAN